MQPHTPIAWRRLAVQDAPAVHALEGQCFSLPWSLEAFQSEFQSQSRAVYYGGFSPDGQLLAYGGYWLIIDEAHITNIAVAPQARRCGIGRELMTVLQRDAAARGIVAMTLEVRASNLPAQALYAGQGFAPQGLRKAYYPDNREDALIYWKQIDPNQHY